MKGWFVGLALVGAAFQPAYGKGLLIDDIIDLAMQDSPEVKMAEESYEIGKYEARSYLAQALPRIDFNYRVSRADQVLSPTSGAQSEDGSPSRFELDDYSWTLRLTSPLYTFGRVGSLYTM